MVGIYLCILLENTVELVCSTQKSFHLLSSLLAQSNRVSFINSVGFAAHFARFFSIHHFGFSMWHKFEAVLLSKKPFSILFKFCLIDASGLGESPSIVYPFAPYV